MLEHISVHSHVAPAPFVDFESARDDFILRSGVRFVLLQIDPERVPVIPLRLRSWKGDLHPNSIVPEANLRLQLFCERTRTHTAGCPAFRAII